MVGKIEQEIKDALKRHNKTIADLCRSAKIDHSMLSRHINGTYTLQASRIEDINAAIAQWDAEAVSSSQK